MTSGNSNISSFRRLVHAKSFDFQLQVPMEKDEKSDTILSILPYLKPGFLEKIRIEIKSDCSEMMRKVVELDQWNLAIELDMCDTPFKLPLQNLIHFKRFSVFIPNISESDVTWLARVSKLKKKENIFKFSFYFRSSLKTIHSNIVTLDILIIS